MLYIGELWQDVQDGNYKGKWKESIRGITYILLLYLTFHPVDKTLFVQMKNDKLDQNAKLATLIQTSLPRYVLHSFHSSYIN